MVKVNKSLLVIGGTGFIGSHLLKSAKKFGYKLTSISLSKPNKRRRARRHGFLKRMSTVGGRRVIKARRSKGRHQLAV